MSQKDLIYAAGFIDGEGCFYLANNRKPAIACENTYKPVVLWLKRMFGGSVTPCKGRKKRHRTTYRWAVVCQDAIKVCRLLIRYLKEKVAQVQVLIAFQKTVGRPGIRISNIVRKQRIFLSLKLKKLKGRL